MKLFMPIFINIILRLLKLAGEQTHGDNGMTVILLLFYYFTSVKNIDKPWYICLFHGKA